MPIRLNDQAIITFWNKVLLPVAVEINDAVEGSVTIKRFERCLPWFTVRICAWIDVQYNAGYPL